MKLFVTLALTAALLFTPTSAAAWFFSPEPPTVHVGHGRLGDAARFETVGRTVITTAEEGTLREDKRAFNQTDVTLVEGPSSALDKYGIERDTIAFRHDAFNADGLFASEVCHQLAGGVERVRGDMLIGRGGSSSSYSSNLGPIDLGSGRAESRVTSGESFYDEPCFGTTRLAGRDLAVAEQLELQELLPGILGSFATQLSSPGELQTFHGRDALNFTFELREEGEDENLTLWFVLADGLSIVAETGYHFSEDWNAVTRLVGQQGGAGPQLPADSGLRLPERDPDGKFAVYDPLSIDDRSLQLRFPFAEAYAWAVGNPKSSLKPWLDAHPNAWLELAFYSRGAGPAPTIDSDGFWLLAFTDGHDATTAVVERNALEIGPLRRSLVPVSAFDLLDGFGDSQRMGSTEAPTPAIIATSQQIAERATAAGVRLEAISSVVFFIYSDEGKPGAYLHITEVGRDRDDGTKKSAGIDMLSGGLAYADTQEQRSEESGILEGPATGDFDRAPVTALSALAGPGIGNGLASGAALTGLALLVVAVKFLLIPLFTRLRRASLLDNPTRSRLYERIRAEPGIHQAELVDYAGLARSVVARHLDQLQRHRFVVALTNEGFSRYYAAGEVPPDLARREAALRAGSRRAVYDLYASRPTVSLRDAARELGMSAPSVHRAKKQLETAGLLPAHAEALVTRAEGARP